MCRPPQLLRCERASYFSTCEFRTYVPPKCQPVANGPSKVSAPSLACPQEYPRPQAGASCKRLRYAVSGVALVILVAFGTWFFFLRFISEKHTVEHFMDAVVAQDFQRAFQIWKSHGSYTYQDFLADWGLDGYYGPIKSYRIESASLPPNGGSGVVVVVEVSPFAPFPENNDPRSGRNKEIRFWVERSDQSLSFPL